jgi:hypothetical protein
VIEGMGVDIADMSRREAAPRGTPSLSALLFAEGEQKVRPASLAGCFALARPGIRSWHRSLSGDGGPGAAKVVAQG